jgi:hypothetical protein
MCDTVIDIRSRLSPRRANLASFENAYAVAVQNREASGIEQFVVRTNDPYQPFRVTRDQPSEPETVLLLVA